MVSFFDIKDFSLSWLKPKCEELNTEYIQNESSESHRQVPDWTSLVYHVGDLCPSDLRWSRGTRRCLPLPWQNLLNTRDHLSSTEDERARSACRHFSTTYFAAQPLVTEYIAPAKQCSCTGSNNGVRRASKAVLTLMKFIAPSTHCSRHADTTPACTRADAHFFRAHITVHNSHIDPHFSKCCHIDIGSR